jgi:hypothetical protein
MSSTSKDHLYSKTQYTLLYYTSWLALFNGLHCLYRGYIDIACCTLAVFFTSILYWREPSSTSWRKYLDMTVSKCALLYQIFRAYNAEFATKCYSLVALATVFYICSSYCFRRGAYWKSVGFHFLVHILLNAGNILLCSGYIPSIDENAVLFYPYGFLGLAFLAFAGIAAAYYIV